MAFRKIQVSNLQSTESAVKDPLLILNQDSSEDVDSGFLSKRGISTYSGLVRDSSTAKFFLIEGINLVSNSLNDISAVDGTLTKGTLELNSLNATTIYVTSPSGAIHTTNLVTENIGYWPADPTDTSKHILTVGNANTPAEYIGNSTGLHTGTVTLTGMFDATNGTTLGNWNGSVYDITGANKILESGTGNLDSALTVDTATATTLNAGTTNISGIATFTGGSVDFTGTSTLGNWNGAVYDRTGSTLIIEDDATPGPIVHADLDGNVTGTVSDISNHGIQSLSDVDSTDTSATGDMLLYDGSQWGLVNYEDEINTRITANNNSLTARSLSDIGFTGDTVANGDFLLYDSSTSKFGYVNFANEVNAYADARIASTNSSHVSFGSSISATAFEGKLYDTNGNVIMDNTSGNVGIGGKTASFDEFDGDLHGEVIHPTTGAKVIDMQYSTPIYTGNVVGVLQGVIYNSNGNPVLDNGSISGTPNFGGNVSGDIDSNGASTFSGSVNFTGATITGLPADLSTRTTDDLAEGTTRKYYTDARVDARISTSFVLPKGTTAQRPASPVEGQMYFNTETRMFEGWDGLDWQQLVPSQFQSTP
jgi:hypothetical protein